MRRKRYTEALKMQLIALVAQGHTPEQLSREYEPTQSVIGSRKLRDFNPPQNSRKIDVLGSLKQRTLVSEKSERSWEKRQLGSPWRPHRTARRVQIREGESG
jgi:hypothetical protein